MSLLLNWNQTELRVVFLLGVAMTKCPLDSSPDVDHEPIAWAQGLLYVRVNLCTTFMNMPLSGLLFFRCGFYVKILIYFLGFFCVCVYSLFVCAWRAHPLNHPVSVRNKSEHSVAQHEQRSFYMSLRSVKAESRWFLKISWLADLLVAPRHYGQLSTTETTPEPGCASPCGSGSIVLSMSRALCQDRDRKSVV